MVWTCGAYGRGGVVSACRNVKVEGKGCRGRPKKTRLECVKEDMKELNLKPEMAHNRSTVERVHSWDPSNPSSHGKTDAKTMMMMIFRKTVLNNEIMH